MKETIRKILLLSLYLSILFLIIVLPINNVEARSGCCSWHGGVCTYKCPDGVNVGYMCCDGTSLSAKCAPYYPRCPTKPTPKCPSYSTYNSSSDSCECNYGYIASGGECINADTYCHDKYGSHSSYDILSKDCKCDYGYTLMDGKCVKPEPIEEQPAKEQSSEQPPAPQRGLPAPEELTAEIPKEGSGEGSILGWIIGIGIVAYLFYTFKKKKRPIARQ
ncbi:hypothetical protein KJA16_01520 [Patescibacteria group bacterium]|nr:hypothetical protein [Patescibacteria group bacterium]